MKRQIYVIPPWGDINSTSNEAILLLEIPVDEEYEFSLTLINQDTTIVIVHTGLCTSSKDVWSKSYLFTLTSDGLVDQKIYVGSNTLTRKEAADWQVWMYRKNYQMPSAVPDEFALNYKNAYLPLGNKPPLDYQTEDYSLFKPLTVNALSTGGTDENNKTIKVFDFTEEHLDTIKKSLSGEKGFYYVENIVKSPSQPVNEKIGSTGEVKGVKSGWSDTRWTESKSRLLAVSSIYEHI